MSEDDKKPAKKPDPKPAEPAAPKIVIFESREQEPIMFDVAGYSSIRDNSGRRLEWHVPSHDVDRFISNFFCQTGRVVKKHGRDQ